MYYERIAFAIFLPIIVAVMLLGHPVIWSWGGVRYVWELR